LETTVDGKVNSVTDYDGNEYPVVQIGSQCWLAQNMRTSHYPDGTAITLGSDTSSTEPYYYYCSTSTIPIQLRGYLYNWRAMMHGAASSDANPSGVQGICPIGWHLPSDAEWTELTDYVNSQSEYQCNSTDGYIAKALASQTEWTNSTSVTCAINNNATSNNSTGFGVIPGGGCFNGTGCSSLGRNAYLWTATLNSEDTTKALCRNFDYDKADVKMGLSSYIYSGRSVRCVRD